jgi:hypothetical protein
MFHRIYDNDWLSRICVYKRETLGRFARAQVVIRQGSSVIESNSVDMPRAGLNLYLTIDLHNKRY